MSNFTSFTNKVLPNSIFTFLNQNSVRQFNQYLEPLTIRLKLQDNNRFMLNNQF